MKSKRPLKAFLGSAYLLALAVARPVAGLLGFGGAYRRYLGRLVRRTGLLDAAEDPGPAERDARPSVAAGQFLETGAAAGWRPQPLFDTAYYLAQVEHDPAARLANPVLHYAFVGRHWGLSPSPHFDPEFYLDANPDVAGSGMDPLLHFIRFGGSEGRSQSRHFNSREYLLARQEIGRGTNPLLHYLQTGAEAAWSKQPRTPRGADAHPVPEWRDWAGRLPARPSGEPLVDVVVPVYRNRQLTLRCLYSVLSAPVRTPYELVVVDDGTPEPELAQALRGLADAGLLTLLTNEVNRGYVFSANRGMQLHPERDVVQLNSDAEVFNNWLDRLRESAYRDRGAGTVTPLSNNATICSYPRFNQDNPEPLELDDAELDRAAAAANRGLVVEAPTGVGFCMYIRRDCIRDVGVFDEENFGRGYGEENDFCQRALAQGWRSLIACDAFVLHHGSASFQEERQDRIGAALRQIGRLHPRYHRDVGSFIRSDPLAPARRRLDEARLQRMAKDANVLLVNHDLGGGTERFLLEEAHRIRRKGLGVFLARPHAGLTFIEEDGQAPAMSNVPALPLHDPTAVREIVARLRIRTVQVHHVLGFEIEAVDTLAVLAQQQVFHLQVFVHDYLAVCPRVNLVDASERYCGEPGPSGCEDCLRRNGSRYGAVSIGPWRQRFAKLFAAASEVVVPDADVADRLRKYFPDLRVVVRPHEPPQSHAAKAVLPPPNGNVRVAVVGAISRIKGLQVLLDCAADAERRCLPLEFVVLGYTSDDAHATARGIEVTGRYREAEAVERLAALRAHAVFLPSVWPETYSYTLSVALAAGLPVFAFDLGAIASRLRAIGSEGGLISLEHWSDAAAINDFILQKCRGACEPVAP